MSPPDQMLLEKHEQHQGYCMKQREMEKTTNGKELKLGDGVRVFSNTSGQEKPTYMKFLD